MEDILTGFEKSSDQPTIIKVVGVGGGGGNAVTHMYKEGIQNVSFALCNTDNQALIQSGVPVILQLGKETTKGLGAGNKPLVAQKAAEESAEDVRRLLTDGTQMVFITAGMGGGTGTGASPVVARISKEMGILTVGIVTIPFLFEGNDKIDQALRGVMEIRKNVDALLIINNQRLIDIYGNLDILQAFAKADSTLTTAARGIAEIITIPGIVNLDFADVNSTLKDGGVAIMNSGFGQGEHRVAQAFDDALNSPLLNNNNAYHAQKILFNIYFSKDKPLEAGELNDITAFMSKFKLRHIKLIWGTALDDSLADDQLKVTILAAGFGMEGIDPIMKEIVEEDKKEEGKIDDYKNEFYGRKSKPYLFQSIEEADDDALIDTLIDHPAHKRDPKILPPKSDLLQLIP